VTTASKNLGDILQYQKDLRCDIVEVDPQDQSQRRNNDQQLESAAQSVAAYLATQGYGPGDCIAIIAVNSLEFIACYLGILKLGAVAVLISAKSTHIQITDMLKDSAVVFVFTDQLRAIDLPQLDLNKKLQDIPQVDHFESYQPDESDIAVILHTSGSTGRPKRVLITHHARLSIVATDQVKRKTLSASPMFHSMGINGVEMNLSSKHDFVFLKYFDAKSYLKTLDSERPDCLVGVPSMFSMLLGESKLIETLNLSSVRVIVLAGGPTSTTLYNKLKKIFDQSDICIGYGTTETGPKIFGSHPNLAIPPGSVGYPQPNVSARLVDGVLQIRNPGMMKGYDDGSHQFTEDGYYITNDLFRIDQNGFYYFVGRSDDMFKSGGNKIFPSEIEQVIETHHNVDKCVVIPVTDPTKDYKPYAFVTIKENVSVTTDELMLFVADRLARYQRPRQIWIIESMPLNTVNKIDKNKLKILAQQNLNI